MGIFNLFIRNKNSRLFNDTQMVELAEDWTNRFIANAPKIEGATYNQDEIYMFICWIILSYGLGKGYINENTKIDDFMESIYQAVRNTGKYSQSEEEQFEFRMGQYKWQIGEMMKCDYPRTKMFFPSTLYARL